MKRSLPYPSAWETCDWTQLVMKGVPECRYTPWANCLPSVLTKKRQVGGIRIVSEVVFGPFLLQGSLTYLVYSSPPIAQEKIQNLGREGLIPSETSPHNWCPMKRVRKDPALKSYKIGSLLRATGCASCFLFFVPTDPTQRLSWPEVRTLRMDQHAPISLHAKDRHSVGKTCWAAPGQGVAGSVSAARSPTLPQNSPRLPWRLD